MSSVERLLHDPDLHILEVVSTPAGRQGAKVLTLRRDGVVLRAKWRSFDSGNLVNEPRKELGAYAVQQLYLSPEDYVIPPTAGHCFPLAEYRARVDATATPSFGTRCVFGFLSYWLPNAHDVDDAEDQGILGGDSLYDEELFRTDTVYRRSLVNLNVTAFLVHHADAHDAQFLLVKDSGSVRVYTVDNSMAFQSITNPMVLFREDWATLRVPLVDTKTRARIAAIDERALQALATVEEYEDRDGMLTPHAITDPTVQRDAGMRWFGKRLQVGLTQGEIAGVRSRVQELKQRLAE